MYHILYKILNLTRKKVRTLSGFFETVKTDGQNIYHCCVQKSGSQWLSSILSDPMVYKMSHMKVYNPHKDFFSANSVQELILHPPPVNKIISPLYIGLEDFLKIPKPLKYKAFFVMRDPRDIVISWYFSAKYSHRKYPPIKKIRKILQTMNDEEAILYLCKTVFKGSLPLYRAMGNWYLHRKENERIIVLRYEELIGEKKIDTFKRLMAHLDMTFTEKDIEHLLEKYHFERFSRGRAAGVENIKSHYRKGVSGDWKNYFSEEHKKIFKEEHGQLLIDLNYEKDLDW
jgi:hypothetical protein